MERSAVRWVRRITVSAESKSRVSTVGSRERQRLESCHQRGKQLALQNEVEYAHEMFVECVLGDPSSMLYVESLLTNLRVKHG